jgi:hypothetical protein
VQSEDPEEGRQGKRGLGDSMIGEVIDLQYGLKKV